MSDVTTLDRPPNLSLLYAKAAVAAARTGGDELGDDARELRELVPDRDHVAAYARTCGFRLRDSLPPTYLHVAAFPLAVDLMARPAFPFALPGLVHIANRITQHRALSLDERPSIRVETRDLRPHRKGRQFDVLAEARIDGTVVWEDRSTYLARGSATASASAPTAHVAGGPPGSRAQPAPERSDRALRLEIPADTGRRYAAVSGDRNPIHLSALAARAFGFPRAIAHGMWTAARCLAAMEGRVDDAIVYDVRFERPVLLPTTVELTSVATDDGWRLALHAARRDDRHLTAAIGPA